MGVLLTVLTNHQRRLVPGGPCMCGGWPRPDHDTTWPGHLEAEILKAVLLATE